MTESQRDAIPTPSTPELRQDPFTREWVVIAPERARRPRSAPPATEERPVALDPDCPFCPGNEDRTPEEVWRLRGADGAWSLRVVPNRHPVLARRSGPVRRRLDGPFITADGFGAHEVIVETPRHDLDLPDLDEAAVIGVFDAYRARSRALRTAGSGLVLPFRNHGAASGTSLSHPHSQVIAVPVVPPRYRRRFDIARAHFEDRGSTLHSDVTAAEIGGGTRVVAVSDRVLAVAPFASAAPYEVRVVPHEDNASFADASDETLVETARMIRRLLTALRDLLGDAPYNYLIMSVPSGEERAGYFSWHLEVLPRLTAAAGFELGTGIAVNTVAPERAAAQLREAVSRTLNPRA